jgi:hypothetical protein
MRMGETELETVERHIRNAEAMIARQHRILRTKILPAEAKREALVLVHHLETALSLHYEHRERILKREKIEPRGNVTPLSRWSVPPMQSANAIV